MGDTVAVHVRRDHLRFLVGLVDDLAWESHHTGIEAPRNTFYEIWESLWPQWKETLNADQ